MACSAPPRPARRTARPIDRGRSLAERPAPVTGGVTATSDRPSGASSRWACLAGRRGRWEPACGGGAVSAPGGPGHAGRRFPAGLADTVAGARQVVLGAHGYWLAGCWKRSWKLQAGRCHACASQERRQRSVACDRDGRADGYIYLARRRTARPCPPPLPTGFPPRPFRFFRQPTGFHHVCPHDHPQHDLLLHPLQRRLGVPRCLRFSPVI